MKKLLSVVALFGMMAACNNKGKDEKKPESDTATTVNTTTTTTTDPTTTTTTPANDPAASLPQTQTTSTDIPTFSDPEIQKFVTDYTAFVKSYKKGIVDVSKAQTLALDAQKWNTKWGTYAQKLASDPKELDKFRTWGEAMRKEMLQAPK